MALSAYAGSEMVPGKTVIFIDEVQECKEALTLVKYLVQRKGFDYILSGSLLGVELRDMRSAPVGHLHVLDMYPLDFLKSFVGQMVWETMHGQRLLLHTLKNVLFS